MKKLFYSHPDTVLASLALVFLVVLLAFYLWASGDIYTEVHQALTFSPTSPVDSFDLAGAAKLDLRGLMNGSSPVPAIIPTPPAALIATTTPATTTPGSASSSTSEGLKKSG